MEARVLSFNPVMRSSDGREMGIGRGAGLHLGAVIKSLREVVDGAPQKFTNDNFALFGFMFELWVGRAMAVYLGHEIPFIIPDEMEVDGIFMNPDGFEPSDEMLYEFKCVWKKCLIEIEPEPGVMDVDAFQKHFPHFLWQVLSYCRGLGCLKASIVVLFVQGTKGDAWGPQFRIFEFLFTEAELEQNWKMICQHAATLR